MARKSKKHANFIERETQLPATPYKAQALNVTLIVGTESASGAWRGRKKANSLVVANGLDVDAGTFGKLADQQRRTSRNCDHESWLSPCICSDYRP